jgi:cytoskeletal protein CcmA (bactofilin family)
LRRASGSIAHRSFLERIRTFATSLRTQQPTKLLRSRFYNTKNMSKAGTPKMKEMYPRKPSLALMNGKAVDPFERQHDDRQGLHQRPQGTPNANTMSWNDRPPPANSLDTMRSEAPQEPQNAVVVIGPGVQLRGEVWNCQRFVVSGNFEGTVAASEVLVEESGMVNASIVAVRVEIGGSVTGQLVAVDDVNILASGSFGGSLVYGKLRMEPGAVVTGNLRKELNAAEQQAVDGMTSPQQNKDTAAHAASTHQPHNAPNIQHTSPPRFNQRNQQ